MHKAESLANAQQPHLIRRPPISASSTISSKMEPGLILGIAKCPGGGAEVFWGMISTSITWPAAHRRASSRSPMLLQLPATASPASPSFSHLLSPRHIRLDAYCQQRTLLQMICTEDPASASCTAGRAGFTQPQAAPTSILHVRAIQQAARCGFHHPPSPICMLPSLQVSNCWWRTGWGHPKHCWGDRLIKQHSPPRCDFQRCPRHNTAFLQQQLLSPCTRQTGAANQRTMENTSQSTKSNLQPITTDHVPQHISTTPLSHRHAGEFTHWEDVQHVVKHSMGALQHLGHEAQGRSKLGQAGCSPQPPLTQASPIFSLASPSVSAVILQRPRPSSAIGLPTPVPCCC